MQQYQQIIELKFENENPKEQIAAMKAGNSEAGYRRRNERRGTSRPASRTVCYCLVASVGVVGVFLGANTSNKNVRFASPSACARRRWCPGTSTGFMPPGIPPLCQLMGCGWGVGIWHVGAGGSKSPVMGPNCQCACCGRICALPSRPMECNWVQGW
jgi:hypothetical protein